MLFRAREIDPAGSAQARLGARLRAVRVSRQLSQAQVGRAVSYSADLVRRVEATERFPALRFAEACDLVLEAGGEIVALWHDAAHERHEAGPAGSTVGPAAGVRFDPARSAAVIDRWLAEPSAVSQTGQPGPGLPVSREEVGVIDSVLMMFRELDHAHGPGDFAAHLRRYIDGQLAAVLARPAADPVADAERSRVATGVYALAGYPAVDSGRPGWAQAYYARALLLAVQAGDRGYGSYLVAVNLAHLALHCDHPAIALKWARHAIDCAGTAASPATRAAMTAVAARALARLGDERAVSGLLTTAGRLLDGAVTADEPRWISYFSPAYLADEMAHCFHDLDE